MRFKYELLERKIFKSTLVLYQDMDAEPCKNYELKGGLKMQKVCLMYFLNVHFLIFLYVPLFILGMLSLCILLLRENYTYIENE